MISSNVAIKGWSKDARCFDMSTVYCIHVGVPCINTLRTAGLFYLLSSAFYPEFIDELKQNKPIIFLHLSTEFGYDFNFFYTMQ